MNSIPLISNVPGVNFNMNRGNTSPEVQMRQEINTSLVALKKEAGTLEGLINEASQILDEVNNRIATLENDTVKKSDVVNVIQSGNMHAVTSNAVAGASPTLIEQMAEGTSNVTDGTEFVSSYASDSGFADTNDDGPNKPYKRKFIKVWNYIQTKISSWMDSIPTSGSSNPITSGGVFSALGAKTQYYYTSIGSYSVNSNATISSDITNNCHTPPQGYKAIRLLFADGDNFFHTTVNYVSSTSKIYATITNNFTGSLSATFYVLELFVKD